MTLTLNSKYIIPVVFIVSLTVGKVTAGESFRFIAIGDLGNPEHYSHLGTALAAACREYGCDQVFTLGDNFYASRSRSLAETDGVNGAEDPRFDRLEAVFHKAGTPVYWIPGNHDYGTSGSWVPSLQANAEHQVNHRQGRYWNMPGRYYSQMFSSNQQCQTPQVMPLEQPFRYLDSPMESLVLALDSTPLAQYQRKTGSIAATSYAKVQGDWASKMLDRSSAHWKIVIAHHPLVSNGRSVPPMKLYQQFMAQYICDKAHLFITGHSHTLEWLWPDNNSCGNTELFISGAGSQPAEKLHRLHPVHHALAKQLGFIHFELTRDSGTVSFLTFDQEYLYQAYQGSFTRPNLP